jgi:hypothetical protein
VQPVPTGDTVTTFHPGETIQVQLQETVYHPGYFRVSFAPVAAADATSSDFPDPALTDTQNCHYDKDAVQTVPHDSVLADGQFMVDDQSGTNRTLELDVTLPSEPCEQCTLQIVQVMEGHPASSCFYFHCANIKIAADDGAKAGTGGAKANAGGGSGTPTVAGKGSAGAPTSDAPSPSSHDSGGCSIASTAGQPLFSADGCMIAIAVLCMRRRRVTRRAA